MDITILRLYDMVINYCISNSVSVVYYEIRYRTEEEKQEILDFYKGKIPFEIHESLNKDDDNFVVFNKAQTALEFAEATFPYLPDIEQIDPKYYIFVSVFNEEGHILWENGR